MELATIADRLSDRARPHSSPPPCESAVRRPKSRGPAHGRAWQLMSCGAVDNAVRGHAALEDIRARPCARWLGGALDARVGPPMELDTRRARERGPRSEEHTSE